MAQIITNNSGGGGGSSADAMLKSVYDPQNINADAFDYDNFTNTPTIPTVNDATLTIQKNSTDVATFTANASSNVTANISVPTDTGDLTNGAGFITNSALSGYQTTSNLVTDLTNPDNTHYPSALAVKNAITAGGNGDVSGPASSTDGDVVLFDGTTGKLIKDSGVTLGTAASCDTGTSSGNVPLLDSNGKLATTILPGVALTDTFTVTNKSDLTSLSTAEQGDIGIVTAESKTYVLSQAPYSTAANWKEILSPTDSVTSVNSQTGAVTLDADDISDSTTTNKFVTTSEKTTWNGKQNALTTQTAYTTKGTATKVPTISTNTLGQVTAITETDITFPVTSVNGNTGAVTVNPGITKVFTLPADLTTAAALTVAQEAYDWYDAGNYPVLYWEASNRYFYIGRTQTTRINFYQQALFQNVSASGITNFTYDIITFNLSDGVVTSITDTTSARSVVATGIDYSTPYTPEYDGSPATKKYVDDHGVPSGGNNGDVLTNVSGTATWSAPSGGDVVVSSQSGNILTSGTKLRAGLESDYQNLGTYDQNTIYLTI